MIKLLAVLPFLLLLAGCPTTQGPNVVDHNVLVTVPCYVTLPEKPVFALTDTGTTKDTIFDKTKKSLAEIEERKAYEAKLEAAARSCGDSKASPSDK